MTILERLPAPPGRAPRAVLADRGDALVGPLSHAMRDRFDVVGQVDAELSHTERLVVAGLTMRLRRRRWAERFFKSNLAVRFRSRRAAVALAAVEAPYDVVFQTHALFVSPDPRTVLYVDCTHRQSMAQWPDWNPLRGRALRRWLDREQRQYHAAAHVFAFCAETRDSLVRQYGVDPDRVSVVGAGVNFDRFPLPRTRHHGPPTVLFVGNDFVRKGGPELLEAFGRLRRQVPDARLRIVGRPYPVAGQPGVEHLGSVADREQMSRLYAEADVFCLPSHFDPFPGVLLEAMAHGLPCVVTPTCGVPEMAIDGGTALFVSDGPGLVPDLAAALGAVLADHDRAERLGTAGRHRVQERFLWSQVVDRMAPHLDRLAEQRTGPPDRSATSTTTRFSTTTRIPITPRKAPPMTQTVDRPASPTTFTVDRPWGRFEQFSLNEPTSVKVITVAPRSRLSLQRHEHRSEFWQVLDGPMHITVGERSWVAAHGEHVWVPAGETHRMGNATDQPTRILEVAFGHFDECDIERLQDDYAR